MTTISEEQKTVHVIAESAALVIGVPWLLKLSKDPSLSESDRRMARWFAWGTLIIDGALLLRFASKSR